MSMSVSIASQFQLKRRLEWLRHVVRGVLQGGHQTSVRDARAKSPLLIAERTYNTDHPDYDANLVRNFPDRMQNSDRPCGNPLFIEIGKLTNGEEAPGRLWEQMQSDVMAEASGIPGFEEVMERKAYIEKYLGRLERRYRSHYVAGWVSLIDAQFLYWVVRRVKPRTIVQTGVSNGLSSAFIMLALAKNGSEGRLHVIDIPAVFDPDDPAWTRKGAIHGEVIPQGKSSGWMVPDMYRDRFAVELGDAKQLLPPLVDGLDTIDMFFHDSDHTYEHMTFEFEQAMRKLAPNSVIVADDIAWNASLWDFADRHLLPSYNYCGSMGIAFLPGPTSSRGRDLDGARA
jgi:predicted O-methyltransferase YrrM